MKVACDAGGRALYFSRAPIPFNRDAPTTVASACLRHVGLYAYRVSALRRLASLPAGRLEVVEKLEQLRALEHGMEIRVALAVERPLADVNTAADLERAERDLRGGGGDSGTMIPAMNCLHRDQQVDDAQQRAEQEQETGRGPQAAGGARLELADDEQDQRDPDRGDHVSVTGTRAFAGVGTLTSSAATAVSAIAAAST